MFKIYNHTFRFADTFHFLKCSYWLGYGTKYKGCYHVIKRIILERVLNLEEIKSIADNSGLETEIFAFGNFCYFYHGRCRISCSRQTAP